MDEKKKKDSKGKNTKFILLLVVAIVAVVAATVLSFVVREAYLSQVRNFVAQETSTKSRLVEHEIEVANAKIQFLAMEATQQLEMSATQNVKFKPNQYNRSFENAGFVRGDGVLVDDQNVEDFSDESFFRDGMAGKSGWHISYQSKKSQQTLISFYYPVMQADSVCGIVLGNMGGRTRLRPVQDSTFNGRPIIEAILDPNFNIIVSSESASAYGLPLRSVLQGAFADKNMEQFRRNAMVDSTTVFPFADDDGASVASIKKIGTSGWYYVVIIPAKDLSITVVFITLISFLVAAFFMGIVCVVIIIMNRANRIVSSESEVRFQNVLAALAETYGSVFEVDLVTGENHTIRVAPVLLQKAGSLFNNGNSYNQIMAVYSNRMVLPEDSNLFDAVRTLDDVKAAFATKSQFDFVFRTKGSSEDTVHYVQAMFVKPSKTRSEFVMGFKNVDDTMAAELDKRKKLSDQRAALEKALEKAQAADKAKSKFLFNMSHDIRTPMNAVLGYEALALRYMWELGLPPEQTEKLARCLSNIQMSGKQLLGLINSVLNMARIESGEIYLDEGPTIVAEITGEVSVTFEESAREKNILLLVSRNLKHKCIMCDKVKVQQIILNIVSNAIKYTNTFGSVKVNFSEVSHEKDGWCYLVTSVEDNGIGISEEFLSHIYEDFEREKSATQSGIVGSGLGLSIVKRFVDLMGGSIEVSSQVGVGTKVVVKTPHKIIDEMDNEGTMVPSAHSEKLQGKRILLVEDNKMNREIAEEMLKSFGVYVDCACNGIECLEKIQQEPPGSFDLVLMDVQMPQMNGYEATRRIRQLEDPLKANILVYAMTANSFAEDKNESLKAGMNGHISKPVDFTKFYNLLRTVFD